jgi:mannosyl-3-phosphoglycerate phosphatase
MAANLSLAHMIILFTDLDGSLLDQSSYSADPAREALCYIKELGLPIVFCSSKTRAEVDYWRIRLSNRHPFITENGAALFIPHGYFPEPFHAPVNRDGCGVIEFGAPYAELVETLRLASQETGCRVRGFHSMSPEEISFRCGLPLQQARLAMMREYDEPFEILDSTGDKLLKAIEARGKRCTVGGRFYHIVGVNNKAHGVCLLTSYFERTFDEIITVGLGDGMNDLDFLSFVDVPVIVRSPAAARMKSHISRARVSDLPGPAGWNQVVLEILYELAPAAEAFTMASVR